jgi:uncharacterized protein (UPF0332 family)
MAKVRLSHQRLLRVGKARNVQLSSWREGVSLCHDSGMEIDELKLLVARDRWRLAALHRRDGESLLGLAQPQLRAAISRLYYAMYHAIRAAAYVYHDGDDHEAHAELPGHVPNDFPSAATWSNKLKDARLARNAADYDPYPRDIRAWRKQAVAIRRDAAELMRLSRAYLSHRGCKGLR